MKWLQDRKQSNVYNINKRDVKLMDTSGEKRRISES